MIAVVWFWLALVEFWEGTTSTTPELVLLLVLLLLLVFPLVFPLVLELVLEFEFELEFPPGLI